MRNTWTRTWLSVLVLLAGASFVVRSQHGRIIEAEDLVVDWVLEDSDVSGWSRLDMIGSLGLIIPVVVVIAVAMFFFDRAAGIAVALTLFFGAVLGWLVRDIVGRPRPTTIDDVDTTSFPNMPTLYAILGVGIVALAVWWFGAPRLVWQIVVEASVVLVLLVAISQVVQGYAWPSDMVGSTLVAGLALISGAIVIESRTPSFRTTDGRDREPVAQ